jgi:hypothetical protein
LGASRRSSSSRLAPNTVPKRRAGRERSWRRYCQCSQPMRPCGNPETVEQLEHRLMARQPRMRAAPRSTAKRSTWLPPDLLASLMPPRGGGLHHRYSLFLRARNRRSPFSSATCPCR